MQENTERPADAIMVTLRDGKPREVLFTMGSIRRIEKLPKISETYSQLENGLDQLAEAFRITDPELSQDKDQLADLIDLKYMAVFKEALEKAMGNAKDAAIEVTGAGPK